MDYGRESWWLRLSNDYFQLTRKCEEKKREKEREREREREREKQIIQVTETTMLLTKLKMAKKFGNSVYAAASIFCVN